MNTGGLKSLNTWSTKPCQLRFPLTIWSKRDSNFNASIKTWSPKNKMCSSSTKHDGKATAWDFKGCLASNELKILMSARKKPEISTKKKVAKPTVRQSGGSQKWTREMWDCIGSCAVEIQQLQTQSAHVKLQKNMFHDPWSFNCLSINLSSTKSSSTSVSQNQLSKFTHIIHLAHWTSIWSKFSSAAWWFNNCVKSMKIQTAMTAVVIFGIGFCFTSLLEWHPAFTNAKVLTWKEQNRLAFAEKKSHSFAGLQGKTAKVSLAPSSHLCTRHTIAAQVSGWPMKQRNNFSQCQQWHQFCQKPERTTQKVDTREINRATCKLGIVQASNSDG